MGSLVRQSEDTRGSSPRPNGGGEMVARPSQSGQALKGPTAIRGNGVRHATGCSNLPLTHPRRVGAAHPLRSHGRNRPRRCRACAARPVLPARYSGGCAPAAFVWKPPTAPLQGVRSPPCTACPVQRGLRTRCFAPLCWLILLLATHPGPVLPRLDQPSFDGVHARVSARSDDL